MSEKYREGIDIDNTTDLDTIEDFERKIMFNEESRKIELVNEVKEINSRLISIEQDISEIKEHLLANV